MVLPFFIRAEECTNIPPMAVYGGYGGFLFISTLIEIYVFMKFRGELKTNPTN